MESYLVTCRSCGTSNRVPADKEGVQGDCGNCKTVLPQLYWRPQQVTEKNFDSFIEHYDGPVIAEFWAPW
jgi:hypothetical protein